MQGGAVARALLAHGLEVTAFVRNSESGPAQELKALGAKLAMGTMDDMQPLEAATAGQDAVFSMQPSGAAPGVESEQAHNIASAAHKNGVKQIIHTSVSATGWREKGFDFEHKSPIMIAYWDDEEDAERAVRESGVKFWTILKPAFYMENFIPPKGDLMFPDLKDGKWLQLPISNPLNSR
ncbi:hypothetical protein GCM10009567_17740 [Rothia amarae]